jgi:hypothetical protein
MKIGSTPAFHVGRPGRIAAALGVCFTLVTAAAALQVPETLAWGTKYRRLAQPATHARPHPPPIGDSMGRLRHWNEVAVNTTGLDHTMVAPGENRAFGEQLGPGRSSRAMAIVHIAVFDAINAIVHRYESSMGRTSLPRFPPIRRGTLASAAPCFRRSAISMERTTSPSRSSRTN